MQSFLIIGAGIAGNSLAYQLLKKGAKVDLMDSGENFSSIVAAGQINPIVFRRMTKSWRVDDFLPYGRAFYEEIQVLSGMDMIMDKSIRRIFSHEDEKKLWLKKQQREDFKPYMHELTDEDLNFSSAKNICGSARIKQSYYVKSTAFLEGIKKLISMHENGNVLSHKLQYEEVDPENGTWNGVKYDKIIFCEGFQNYLNPWFKQYPVNTAKGQVLTIESEDMYKEESLNRKCFVLPLENGNFRVGATYEWHDITLTTTEAGRAEIEENIEKLTSAKYKVIGQDAGIRPTSVDRRPIMGYHPEFQNLAIYNGLGTKGYMLAPYLSLEYCDFLLDGKHMDKEVDINRF